MRLRRFKDPISEFLNSTNQERAADLLPGLLHMILFHFRVFHRCLWAEPEGTPVTALCDWLMMQLTNIKHILDCFVLLAPPTAAHRSAPVGYTPDDLFRVGGVASSKSQVLFINDQEKKETM